MEAAIKYEEFNSFCEHFVKAEIVWKLLRMLKLH